MLKQIAREQAILQMMFQRTEDHVGLMKENEMLRSLVETQKAQIKELEDKLLPPEFTTAARDM